MVPTRLINPFNVDPRLELPHVVEAVPNWSEYHYFFAYDPVQNIGVSVHIGRLLSDAAIWRGIVYVFLPNDIVLARRYAGRDGHSRGPGAGPFRASCVEPLRTWTLDFDGALQRTSQAELANSVLRDGVDELVQFHIVLDAAAPLFSLEAHAPEGATWSHHHHEQIHRIRGDLTFEGQRYDLQGVGARDHSSGPRDYTPLLSAYWAQILFPSGRAVHATVVRRRGSDQFTGYISSDKKYGYIYLGDETPLEMVEILGYPELCHENTPLRSIERDVMQDERRRQFDMVMKTSRGVQTLHVERIRAVATTYVPPSDEIGGTDLMRQDSLQQGKTIMRVTWDGEVGYGVSDCLTAIRYLTVG